ncbi:NVEALA domain-containing protein [Parabacteroides goldsteinii]|uniref:NVEALA domain-containing protein n=1 Tax=Parabacteroides goldsteinii TaxID=328812 RepID=UPI0021653D52|nr:NVEALA domain-containing protein [Parabacteroides goldsteinii]MCS2427782.1 NVEALA domain-containing protein [Parabacteroides goldsteinii]
MKKKIFGAVLITAMAVTAGWNFNQSKNETQLSDLALANVEALANPEGPGGPTFYNRRIVDEITSMEFLEIGVKTTYKRSCPGGGSDACSSGTWSDFTPR